MPATVGCSGKRDINLDGRTRGASRVRPRMLNLTAHVHVRLLRTLQQPFYFWESCLSELTLAAGAHVDSVACNIHLAGSLRHRLGRADRTAWPALASSRAPRTSPAGSRRSRLQWAPRQRSVPALAARIHSPCLRQFCNDVRGGKGRVPVLIIGVVNVRHNVSASRMRGRCHPRSRTAQAGDTIAQGRKASLFSLHD